MLPLHKSVLLICLSLVLAPTSFAEKKQQTAPSAGGDEDYVFDRVQGDTQPYGYVLNDAVWKFGNRSVKAIFVCWENPEAQPAAELVWVRDAVEQSWQKHSALMFLGWRKCKAKNTGIRIRIADDGPHVKKLGKYINGMPNGMVLNFTFDKWSRSCKTMREYCVRTIAVHEFGHAIAFAHEQNRHDAPGECQELSQGSDGDNLLTPYDPSSVMNYCNEKYSNDGLLSDSDIVSVQALYCAPDKPYCEPQF